MDNENKSNQDELIDLYYESAIKGLEEEWFINIDARWYNYITALPIKEKVTYHIAILDEEVSNGGFHQYFINGYGQFAKDTILSLDLINAKQTGLILKKAYDLINKDNLEDTCFREKILNNEIDSLYEDAELNMELNNLDEIYSDYPDNIGKLLLSFLASNITGSRL